MDGACSGRIVPCAAAQTRLYAELASAQGTILPERVFHLLTAGAATVRAGPAPHA